jgi:hypothetical protein
MKPLWKSVEVVSGFLLIINQYVPAALLSSAPVVINILAFHLFLDSTNPIGWILLSCHLATAWHHRNKFAAIFSR